VLLAATPAPAGSGPITTVAGNDAAAQTLAEEKEVKHLNQVLS
jgi:hypothetical protein